MELYTFYDLITDSILLVLWLPVLAAIAGVYWAAGWLVEAWREHRARRFEDYMP